MKTKFIIALTVIALMIAAFFAYRLIRRRKLMSLSREELQEMVRKAGGLDLDQVKAMSAERLRELVLEWKVKF